MGTYKIARTEGEAAALSIKAGVDMDFAGCSYSHLEDEVNAGRVSEADLDRAVANVLRVKFATGLFDRPANVSMRQPSDLDTPEYRSLAREAAEQSIVLLMNKNMPDGTPALPESSLSQSSSKNNGKSQKTSDFTLLLAGPLIDDAGSQNGGYSHGGAPTTTFLQAAQQLTAVNVVSFLGTSNGTSGKGDVTANDPEAIATTAAAAAKADVAVLVLGDDLNTCAEMGDRSALDLLGGQAELLQRVSLAAKKTVVVLVGGRPLTFETGPCVKINKTAADASAGDTQAQLTEDGNVAFPWDPNARVGAACEPPVFSITSPLSSLPGGLGVKVGQHCSIYSAVTSIHLDISVCLGHAVLVELVRKFLTCSSSPSTIAKTTRKNQRVRCSALAMASVTPTLLRLHRDWLRVLYSVRMILFKFKWM